MSSCPQNPKDDRWFGGSYLCPSVRVSDGVLRAIIGEQVNLNTVPYEHKFDVQARCRWSEEYACTGAFLKTIEKVSGVNYVAILRTVLRFNAIVDPTENKIVSRGMKRVQHIRTRLLATDAKEIRLVLAGAFARDCYRAAIQDAYLAARMRDEFPAYGEPNDPLALLTQPEVIFADGRKLRLFIIPHPSGRCREWNQEGVKEEAGRMLRLAFA